MAEAQEPMPVDSAAAEAAKAEANIAFKGRPLPPPPRPPPSPSNRSSSTPSTPADGTTPRPAHLLRAEHHFPQAVVGYTRAIDLDPSNAVYYSNRAFAHIKLENFGSAIADATKSLELDPTYVKVRPGANSCPPPLPPTPLSSPASTAWHVS